MMLLSPWTSPIKRLWISSLSSMASSMMSTSTAGTKPIIRIPVKVQKRALKRHEKNKAMAEMVPRNKWQRRPFQGDKNRCVIRYD